MDQYRIQKRLIELNVAIVPHRVLSAVRANGVEIECVFTGRVSTLSADAVVMVASRLPESTLSAALQQRQVEWQDAGILDVTTIGDALAPATIAASVYAGRRYAEELGAPVNPNAPLFQREVAELRPFDVRALFSRDT